MTPSPSASTQAITLPTSVSFSLATKEVHARFFLFSMSRSIPIGAPGQISMSAAKYSWMPASDGMSHWIQRY
ncbi:hypothetical protein BGX30_004413, partial [Mortierella sp. GBA39]